VKAKIFVISQHVERTDLEHPHFSWSKMREMTEAGLIEIEAHTHNGHRRIYRGSWYDSDW